MLLKCHFIPLSQEASSFDVESITVGEKINSNYFFKNAVALVVSCSRVASTSHRE